MSKDKTATAETACGGKVEDPGIYPSTVYDGETIYFCTKGCQKAFEADPEGFMSCAVDHPADD